MCFPTLVIVKFIKWLMSYNVFHVCQKRKYSPYFLAVHIQSVIIAYWEGIQILITHMQLLLYEYKSCILSNCCIVCEFNTKRIWFSIYYVWAFHYWWKIVPLFPASLKFIIAVEDLCYEIYIYRNFLIDSVLETIQRRFGR